MTAMFPDSGVPAADARNATDPSTNCPAELWYSTSRCQPRFDPAAANAMLSEVTSAVNWGEVVYDCYRLDNLSLSIRRQIQRGIPKFSNMTTTVANTYAATLDPVATRYNNGMALSVVPNTTNTGAIIVNVNGLGGVYVLRSDGAHLEAGDFKANIPYMITFWNGYFFLDGLVPSQAKSPQFMTSDADFWIDWQGDDYAGDGTYAKPFRTINGCWARVGGLFLPSPYYAINIRMKQPGDYEGGVLWNYGGMVRVIGDENNPVAYRVKSMSSGVAISTQTMWFAAISGECLGINIANTGLPPVGPNGLVVERAASVMCRFCAFSNNTPGNGGLLNWIRSAGQLFFDHHNQFIGDNTQSYGCILVSESGVWTHTGGLVHHTISFTNFTTSTGLFIGQHLGSMTPRPEMFSSSNCHGLKYNIQSNSVLDSYGNVMPGDINGVTSTGGQFI